jgi:GT2 family glycosyltransferase
LIQSAREKGDCRLNREVALASIFVHIVTFNNKNTIEPCLRALVAQEKVSHLKVVVTDNNSSDDTLDHVVKFLSETVSVHTNSANIGFAAAHNWGVARFLESDADFLVILNPDVALERNALSELSDGFQRWPSFGAATGLLLRSDGSLQPLQPEIIDSAGIEFTPQFRHLDRFAGRLVRDVKIEEGEVQGATGAYLAIRRKFIERVSLDAGSNSALFKLYPSLREGAKERKQLFDEAFFAYREDAELALRGGLLGERFVFIPRSRGAHQRQVTPERRSSLAPQINKLGVRNRFLLQLAVFSWRHHWRWFLGGIIWRNLVVILGVFFHERTSLGAFWELFLLLPRALQRRRELFSKLD